MLSLVLSGTPASAQSALLNALSSRVTLTHPGGVPDEVAAERIIQSGDTVATDETGGAVVTYPDGSTALLEENSALTIEFVRTSAGDYAVRMQQTLGRVWYAVTSPVSLGGRYEVRSPGMASVVRAGSDSYVVVSPSGETTVVTISGTVDTSAGGAEVTVPAGSSVTVSGPGAIPVPATVPVTQAVVSTQTARAPAPSTPPPSTPKPRNTPVPSPTNAFLPPVATLPPLTMSAAAPKPKPTPTTIPIATPKPLAAPAPASTPLLKDKFGPRKDAPGQPPPKAKL